jgi:hypothetical protein
VGLLLGLAPLATYFSEIATGINSLRILLQALVESSSRFFRVLVPNAGVILVNTVEEMVFDDDGVLVTVLVFVFVLLVVMLVLLLIVLTLESVFFRELFRRFDMSFSISS